MADLGAALNSQASQAAAALRELMAFSQHRRLLTLQLAEQVPGASSLVVERAEGVEGLNCLDAFSVDVLSPSAYLELESMIGVEAGLSVCCADGSQRRWFGLVTQVASRGADGGLARYRLQLSPWPAVLALREDSFVFQQQTTLETVETLLADYPLARYALRVSEATRSALPRHAIRTQYRESDLAFLQRLLAADGLSFWFEHDSADAAAGGGLRHTLVIADGDHDWPAAAPGGIRYRRLSATESEDAIHGFVARQQLVSNATARSGWNAGLVAAPAAADLADFSDGVPLLEDHDAGSDRGRADCSAASAQRIARLRLQAHQAEARVFTGESSVRRLAPGHSFALLDHPDLSAFSPSADARFKLTRVEHTMSNNLRTGLDDDGDRGERGTYRNRFECVPREVPLVPQPRPLPPAPGLLTALVVGVAGEGATSHRNHAVRIQFHFQRGIAPNPGGLSDTGWPEELAPAGNATGNETSGTWVRVAQALAGPDWGEVFVPRIGTEVLVSFEQGDLDRPLIVGSLHNGQDLPPFQAGIDSGVDHPGFISGLHTRVLMAPGSEGNDGYNQLLFDDAPGQLGAQLASSTQASQLNLGTLVQRRPGTAERGALRGEGAEMTTDAWAVLRAGQGALLSASAQPGAAGQQLDAQEALRQLQEAAEFATELSNVAVAQGSSALTTAKDIQALHAMASATRTVGDAAPVTAFSAPILLQETPASAVLASPASIVGFAGQSLHLVAQGHAHFTAGKTIELASGRDMALFTQAGGISAVAANGPVSIQAQTDALSLLADQSVSISSTQGKIEVSAQTKIVLQAGHCSITLEGGDITFAMPGVFSVKGAQQMLGGGGAGQVTLPLLPSGQMAVHHWIGLHYLDAEGLPMAAVKYTLRFSGGAAITGVLDADGRGRHEGVPNELAGVEYEARQPEAEAPAPEHAALLAAARSRLA